jgi:5-methylcytosine-specific restriction endonuclease McrA
MNSQRNELINAGWSAETLELAIATRFRCAYCDLDFMSSVDAYYSCEVEHIVPLSKKGKDEPENKTVVCSTCNFLKRAWDPRSEAGEKASREQLLAASKHYVQARRLEKEKTINREKVFADFLRNRA